MAGSVSLEELEKAVATLNEALDFSDQVQGSEIKFKIARDACIQRFEYCIELTWKVAMKKLGSTTKFAKPAIREMARADLVTSAELWLHPYSDVDLLYRTSSQLPTGFLANLRESIEDSHFPYAVDLVGENDLAASYRDNVTSSMIEI